ncbi:MAG: site-2 protease family protein [Pirellulaceae bacterium]
MKWSLKLARIAGIDVFVHWTFAILIIWLITIYVAQGSDFWGVVRGVGFVLAIFGCVVLHELGHALTARRFGIRTRDITLLPIGGVARLERMPEDPKQELLVALAGPAVNLVIAIVLFGLLYLVSGTESLVNVKFGGPAFLAPLMFVNVFLAVFNMLPAFPMDGGRVLRAMLALTMDYSLATQTAATIGQAIAIVFGLLGLLYNPLLIFIALFVFLGAQQEAQMVQMRSLTQGLPVRETMVTHFRTVAADTPLSEIVEALLRGEQQDFPVVDRDAPVGVLTRSDLIRALAEGRHDGIVADVMRDTCGVVDEREMLNDVLLKMQEAACPMMPVVRDGQLVGIVTLENIGEWVMIQSALQKASARRHVDNIYEPRQVS